MTSDAAVLRKIAELARRGQHDRAAALCVEMGDHMGAAVLLEQACEFAGAAKHALDAGDGSLGARLAALAGDEDVWERALQLLCTGEPDVARRAAEELSARGFPGRAGVLLERLREFDAAARAYGASGDALASARCLEAADRPADAARALEAALGSRPDDAGARLALGRLLARHGRAEAAVRAFQQIGEGAERRSALPPLERLLGQLGLEHAARAVRAEISAGRMELGGAASERDDSNDLNSAGAGSSVSGATGVLMWGRYEKIRDVAATPHARVIEAVDRVTGARVAVKVLDCAALDAGRDALARFEREARALAALRHPNVVPLLSYVVEGPAMILAWMPGGSLADAIRRGPMAPARAAEIAHALLDALGEAHRLGILHRDVKPANVLFDEMGTVRLSDFGTAHLGDLASTATAGAIGTFAYMSPEQRLGRPATFASDLYSVGVIFAELLTGAAVEPCRRGRIEPAPSACNPDLDAAHDALVACLIDEDPARRPCDAFEARRALTSLAWSRRVPDRPAVIAATVKPPATPASGRLGPARVPGDGRDAAFARHDLWLGRDVLVMPADDATMVRARAFAQVGHSAFAAVLRIDRDAGEVWVDRPRGRALADEPRPLSPGDQRRLAEAIEALHAVGGAHGCVDAEHVYAFEDVLTLAWPRRHADDGDTQRDLGAIGVLAAALDR